MITFAQRRFLDLIAFSEGTSTHPLTRCSGYDVIVSGVDGQHTFTDYSTHPFALGRSPVIVRRSPLLLSTASGRYQLLLRYWSFYTRLLSLSDYSPASQDAIALQQIRERGALGLLEQGDVTAAISRCSPIWASFPNSPTGEATGQRGHTIAHLLDFYHSQPQEHRA